MFSIPLRLAVGMLVLVAVPGLMATLGRWHPAHGRTNKAQPAAPEPQALNSTTPTLPPSAHRLPTPTAPPESESEPEPAFSANSQPVQTSHARLILDGHFARRIGLLDALGELEMSGKTVSHVPQDYLVTALVNVLAGHDQLQEISRGDNPLRPDLTLAQAWAQAQFPEVSGVCRQLHATDWAQAQAVRERLAQVFQPYLVQCAGPALSRGERLTVDWDLTAKQITTDAKSEPFAAYGHMETDVGKGYQWAEATLRGTAPDGQPRTASLGGFLCPGNAHPDSCLERLRLVTEAALGRPRRRPDLLRVRLTAAQAQEQARQARVVALQAKLSVQQQQVEARLAQLQAIAQRQGGRRPEQQALLARDERAKEAVEKRVAASQQRLAALPGRIAAAQGAVAAAKEVTASLEARLARLEADNAALDASHQPGVSIELVLDSQFGGSEQIIELLEEGYLLTTKAISPATMTKLRQREARGEVIFGPWRAVSANAEVAECTQSSYAECPYPLRLLGYRKHLAGSASRPAQTSYALFLTSIPAQERTAEETVQHYHVRGGTVELLNREAKSNLGFRGHRLRHAPGLDILGQFVFAGLNFVPWLADTVWAESGAEAGERPGLTELTQMARALGQTLADDDGVAVQFAQDGGWPQRTLRLGVLRQPPLPGFVWPGVQINAQLPPQNSNRHLVARKLG